MNDTTPATPNRLIHEKSPYLLQHAHNPVDWYPWGEEAFEEARRSGRPIFVSIGYSTCHWCHVMERESFENPETAAMMNELFVNIKVDREERPDVDHVYMTAAMAISGSGGWPLSAWLTHDLRPFYVGTYFPPEPAFGRPSFRDALQSLHDAWVNDREKIDGSASAITRAIEGGSRVVEEPGQGTTKDDDLIETCYLHLSRSFDPVHGGFGSSPKFPRPSIFEFLLRYYAERSNEEALRMVLTTLRRMSEGGMYDQLGGGFARYSVDAEWKVPHFEKMLYDQGQILAALADAYRITRDAAFAATIRQTVEYLERDMLSPEGAFYSAEDADSEGEEGRFYVWTKGEIEELLEAREAEAIVHRYGITSEGNFEHGKNVLHTSATIDDVAARTDATPDEIEALLDGALRKLFDVRSRRIRPSRDEKILASWNGLMITGLARAAGALDDAHVADLARRAADFILDRMIVDGRLMHRYRDGEVAIPGYLDDYAFLAQGLLDLYEATFDVRYIREADRLARAADVLFGDREGGGYFMTSGEDTSVLVRAKSDHDGAEPSGNSVMAFVLLRLGRLFYDDELKKKGERTVRLFAARVAESPTAMPLMMAALVMLQHPPRQVIIAASDDPEATHRLVAQARGRFAPDTALVLNPAGGADPWLVDKIPTMEGMDPVNGKPAAFVCENFTCMAPVTEL